MRYFILLWIIHVISVLCLLYFRAARLFIDALWSPAGKGLTSWLSFVMSYCELVIFLLVSWARCGTLLYRSPIFAFFHVFYLNGNNTVYFSVKLGVGLCISSYKTIYLR